jgi:hypothetical protein
MQQLTLVTNFDTLLPFPLQTRTLFLYMDRFHEFDSLAAARRIANHWKKRKRAFLPITLLTGQGAMTADDVRILQIGYCINLPRDKKNRTVLYVDVSKRRPDTTPFRRKVCIFFLLQCVMENETSRNDAFVLLFNISNPFAANFEPTNGKYPFPFGPLYTHQESASACDSHSGAGHKHCAVLH